MRNLFRISLALLLGTVFGTALAGDLAPRKAQYKVKVSVVSGKLNTELRATDGGYTANHVIRPTGLSRVITSGKMNVTAEFATGPDGVRPVTFHEIDTIRDDPETRLSFDWSTNQVSGTVGSEEVTLQLDGIAHDGVSIQYALMHDLLYAEPAETYVLFDVDKLRVADVKRAGEKTVKTKAGRFDVIGISHQRKGSSRVTTMWCAPELDYLPVIIEQHRKGKLNFRATLTSYTPI